MSILSRLVALLLPRLRRALQGSSHAAWPQQVARLVPIPVRAQRVIRRHRRD